MCNVDLIVYLIKQNHLVFTPSVTLNWILSIKLRHCKNKTFTNASKVNIESVAFWFLIKTACF